MSLYGQISADTPTAYWPMQETAGSTLVDDAGSNDATLTAPFTLNAHVGPDCAGPTNRSVEFDASGAWNGGSWADAANVLSGDVDASVELVVLINSGGLVNFPTFISQRGLPNTFANVQKSYLVEATDDGSLFVRWADSSNVLSDPGAIKEGCWNHIFVQHETSTQKVTGWVNGCPSGEFTTSGTLNAFATRIVSDLLPDPSLVTHLLDGYLAHVAVYGHLGPGNAGVRARALAMCGRCRGKCDGGWGRRRFGGAGF